MVVTALTVVLVGGVIVATTSVGCGAANKVGLKLVRCAGTNTTASRTTPPPFVIPTPSAKGGPFPPNPAPATYYPPQSNPATYYPPQNNPATYYPPNSQPGSSGLTPQDPFYPAASGGAPPPPTLNCTLPVFAGPPGSGGFVTFPGGSFTADPRSAVAPPSPGPVQGPGYGYQPYGMTYDRTHSRWLPVQSQLVAPDGNHYAYAGSDGIYIVDAANGTEVEVGGGHGWSVIRVLNDKVYASVPNTPGLWIVPFSGTPTQVTTSGYWQAAIAGAAFGTSTSAVPQGTTQKLLRLDIATGKTSDWFSTNGATVSVSGFDYHGNPIVLASYLNSWELWVTSSPTSGYVMANSSEQFYVQGPLFADSHGVWLPIYYQPGQTQGQALYIAGSGLFLLTQIGAQIAGGCA